MFMTKKNKYRQNQFNTRLLLKVGKMYNLLINIDSKVQ